jgi:hypothetical protein
MNDAHAAAAAAPAAASSADLLSSKGHKQQDQQSGDYLDDEFSYFAGQVEQDEVEEVTDDMLDGFEAGGTTHSSASIVLDDLSGDSDDDQHNDSNGSRRVSLQSAPLSSSIRTAQELNTRSLTSETLHDLPFVLDVPSDYEDLVQLLHKRSCSDVEIILYRILKSNHPSLGPAENRSKIEVCQWVLYRSPSSSPPPPPPPPPLPLLIPLHRGSFHNCCNTLCNSPSRS